MNKEDTPNKDSHGEAYLLFLESLWERQRVPPHSAKEYQMAKYAEQRFHYGNLEFWSHGGAE